MIKISILGHGNIGLPLAQTLKDKFTVVGSISDQSKIREEIPSYPFSLQGIFPDELAADITILTIPPKPFDLNHLPQIKTNWLIYTSSISVYGAFQGNVSENTAPLPDDESGKKILEIENWVKTFPHWTILRLGGLLGEQRHPGKYLSGRKDISHPKAPVNLIHHDDVVKIIEKIILLNKKDEIYNCVCDEHHSRQEFYEAYSRKHQTALPEFKNENAENYKLVLNDKIKQHLGIEFTYTELIEKCP
jgi:nucleoside-diphosphate-sugar epimerase